MVSELFLTWSLMAVSNNLKLCWPHMTACFASTMFDNTRRLHGQHMQLIIFNKPQFLTPLLHFFFFCHATAVRVCVNNRLAASKLSAPQLSHSSVLKCESFCFLFNDLTLHPDWSFLIASPRTRRTLCAHPPVCHLILCCLPMQPSLLKWCSSSSVWLQTRPLPSTLYFFLNIWAQ